MKKNINILLLFLSLCIYTPTFSLSGKFSHFCKENKTTLICSGLAFILGVYFSTNNNTNIVNNTPYSSIKGDGNITIKKVILSSNVTKLNVKNIANVLVYYSENSSYIQTSTDENIQEYATPLLTNQSINLGIHSNKSCSPTKLTYHVYLQDLKLINTLTTSGLSNVVIDPLITTQLDIKTKESSNLTIKEINTNKLTIQTQGSSNLNIKNNSNTTNLNIEGIGSSEIQAKKLNADQTIIRTQGSSNVLLGNLNTVEIEAYGYSTIDINDAQQVSGKTFGSSTIKVPVKTEGIITSKGFSTIKRK